MAFPDNQRPNLKADPDAMLPGGGGGGDDDGFALPGYEEEGPYLAEGVEQCIQGLAFPDSYPY